MGNGWVGGSLGISLSSLQQRSDMKDPKVGRSNFRSVDPRGHEATTARDYSEWLETHDFKGCE